jgi:hypothetical protein
MKENEVSFVIMGGNIKGRFLLESGNGRNRLVFMATDFKEGQSNMYHIKVKAFTVENNNFLEK